MSYRNGVGSLVITLTLVVSGIFTSGSFAATVERDSQNLGQLNYIASPGVENDLTITSDGTYFFFADLKETITVPNNECLQVSLHLAKCLNDPNNFPPVNALKAQVLDLDDYANNMTPQGAKFYGGSGDDVLYGDIGPDTLYGNEGKDLLVGTLGKDVIDGDSGDDDLQGGGDADILTGGANNDQLDGGYGTDEISGGDDYDTVDYTNRKNPLHVDLSVANGDGEAFENDNVKDDTEFIFGGSGSDVLIGSAAINAIIGADGDDTIYGRGGDDYLLGYLGSDSLYGGSGNDMIEGELGDDTLRGEGGDDSLSGGLGSDLLSGAAGSDLVSYTTYATAWLAFISKDLL